MSQQWNKVNKLWKLSSDWILVPAAGTAACRNQTPAWHHEFPQMWSFPRWNGPITSSRSLTIKGWYVKSKWNLFLTTSQENCEENRRLTIGMNFTFLSFFCYFKTWNLQFNSNHLVKSWHFLLLPCSIFGTFTQVQTLVIYPIGNISRTSTGWARI